MFFGGRGKKEEKDNEADTCNISSLHSNPGKLGNYTSQQQLKDQLEEKKKNCFASIHFINITRVTIAADLTLHTQKWYFL